MFFYGQQCPICEQPITQGQSFFGSWGVWLPEGDPLLRFCDAAMHWDCYAAWPHRERFASSYFQFWVNDEKRNVHWHRAFLDGDVLVTVNPWEPVRSAWVHLRATGSRIDVKLDDWAKWLESDLADTDEHPVYDEAVRQAKTALRPVMPTVAALEAAIDQPRKRAVVEEHQAAEQLRRKQQREVQREITPHNAACNRLMKLIERNGLTCPHCGTHSKDYRVSRRKGQKSAVICTSCGWVVEPVVPPRAGPQTEERGHV